LEGWKVVTFNFQPSTCNPHSAGFRSALSTFLRKSLKFLARISGFDSPNFQSEVYSQLIATSDIKLNGEAITVRCMTKIKGRQGRGTAKSGKTRNNAPSVFT
jgi:hypothetical protein